MAVAGQLGHAPTMTLDVYGHVFAELDARERRSAEDLIREARENVRVKYARSFGEEVAGALKSRLNTGSRRPDSNRGPLHYE